MRKTAKFLLFLYCIGYWHIKWEESQPKPEFKTPYVELPKINNDTLIPWVPIEVEIDEPSADIEGMIIDLIEMQKD
jgi:hypothetical protein